MSEFGKHLKARLLSPRLFIYVILAMASSFIMVKYGPKETEKPSKKVQMPKMEYTYETISSVNEKLPLIIVFADSDQAEALTPVMERAGEFKGTCQVMLITAAQDDLNAAATFGVTSRPCAILIDRDDKEIGRITGPSITFEDLEKLKIACLQETSDSQK